MPGIFNKTAVIAIATLSLILAAPVPASAHIVVTPGEITTSARTNFAVSVPNEHDTPVVKVRLVLPEGLASVRPFAKTGWNISVAKTGEGENVMATEITWTSAGGTVPADMKDEFLFSALVPAEPTELKWKAYETYQDGLVVAWDQEPGGGEDNKPYSVTKVVGETETQASLKKIEQATADADKAADRALYLSIIAALLGVAGIVLATRKK